ncbi:AraC family transcriptional regulator [Kocuria flava]|uniref:AraC family transcriptional regulator n=1 Tax=Kocuria flava TaxID=446860 RepID=A0A0U3HDY8_9MICC|nr:helix-turn-helix domain-containing protein [Kocuria flava]ALU39016.1 AraC family transcriptional regulator [Kocuria flava]GEO91409.1 AraC family transcriptional regulator [Kocuria flava]
MIRSVAVVVFDEVSPFELGVACEAWGIDRSADGLPVMDFAVCSPGGRAVRTTAGFDLAVHHGLDRVAAADLVVLPAMSREREVPAKVLDVLRAASARGARLLSICSGAFVLGAAGLLDGRRCTTHWMHTAELAARFPAAQVVPEVLYVEDGPVLTSAGTAAGLDACLHLWRQEFGSAAANTVARRMVVPPQREGGQAQFIKDPVPERRAETLDPLLGWIVAHLGEPLDVDALARRAAMSPRTFARRFRDETGTTPHAWITARRLHRAEQLLEETDLPVERIAADVGFGNAATLRHHFARVRRLSPQQYRRRFATTA